MKKVFFFLNLLLLSLPVFAQHFKVAEALRNACGPAAYKPGRVNITGQQVNQHPYDAIVHFGINNGNDWGTAAFISDTVLVTARHVVMGAVNQIQVYKDVFKDGKMQYGHVTIDNNQDFVIRVFDNLGQNIGYANEQWVNKDFAFIILTPAGKKKASSLYTSRFLISNYKLLGLKPGATLHLSGYPYDQAGAGENGTDILSDKPTTVQQTLFKNNDSTAVGYRIYTCNGDSGAPFWVQSGNGFYIVGVHHGGNENIIPDNDGNIACYFNGIKMKLINGLLHIH